MATFIRILGLTRLNDGSIAARDFLTPTIRVFSPTGKFVRVIGRQGRGPGELEMADWHGAQGDTVVAYDVANEHVTRFRQDGGLISSARLLGVERGDEMLGRLRDGTWIVETFGVWQHPRTAAGIVRDSFGISAVTGVSPTSKRRIATAPGFPVFSERPGPAPFAARTDFAVSGDLVWIGDNATNFVRAVDANGREVRRIVLPWAPTPVTRAMIAQLKQQDLERARMVELKQMVERNYESDDRPSTTPVFNTFFVGKDGNVWVEGFTLGRRGPTSYLVYTEDGKPVARVQGPAGLHLRDAGADWVLGIHYDADEVETIRLHRLEKR